MAIAGEQLPLTVYAYSRCSTCRKALNWLSQQGLSVGEALVVIEITAQPPSKASLAQALAEPLPPGPTAWPAPPELPEQDEEEPAPSQASTATSDEGP